MAAADDLRTFRQNAGHLAPDLRAAALLRIARVLNAYDHAEALACFDEALESVRALREPERDLLMAHARLVAAAIAPERLPLVEVSDRGKLHFGSDHLVKIMLDHGRTEAAIDWALNENLVASEFPFGMVRVLVAQTSDQEMKTALDCRSVQAWSISRDQEQSPAHRFLYAFAHLWNLLPEAEARAVVHQIVAWARTRVNVSISAGYGNDVQFTNEGESTLFQVLYVLRVLDPGLAGAIVATYPQLNAAAQRYPDGLESMMREANARMAAGNTSVCSERDMEFVMSSMRSSADERLEQSLQHAFAAYAEDTAPEAPNTVSKEFWPSTHYFRALIYQAGKKLGAPAVALLDRAPDPDLRLLAAIELEAALSGLPEFRGIRAESRPPGRGNVGMAAISSPVLTPGEEVSNDPGLCGPHIRCPKCNWQPRKSDRWACECHHVWNTFDTGGICPGCMREWKETQCLRCHQWSPHSEWYTQT